MLSELRIIYLEEKDWMNDIKIKGIFLKSFLNRDSLTKYICKITQMRLKFGNYGKTPRNRNSP